MIENKVFEFLHELERNNNREWFHANKKKYEEAKINVEKFVGQLILDIGKFDPDVIGQEAKRCMFRIYRDVRFSKNKDPYKTNFGGFIVKSGRSSGNAGYYLHLENNNSFIAGGVHMPPAPLLKKIRQEIYYNAEEFKSIIHHKDAIKYLTEISGEKLKRAPKDFPADFPDIELLKFKSFGFLHNVLNDQVQREDYFQYVMHKFKLIHPMVKFINRAYLM